LKKFVVERQDAKDAKVGKKREEVFLGASSLGVLGVLAFNYLFNRAASRPWRPGTPGCLAVLGPS
jgi:hypothetical protein